MVDNVKLFEINKTNQTKALMNDRPLGQSLVALLQSRSLEVPKKHASGGD